MFFLQHEPNWKNMKRVMWKENAMTDGINFDVILFLLYSKFSSHHITWDLQKSHNKHLKAVGFLRAVIIKGILVCEIDGEICLFKVLKNRGTLT